MNKPSLILASSLLFLSGICTAASDEGAAARNSSENAAEAAAPAATEEAAKANPDDEMICRREVITGSNFSRRVCRTRAERRAIREESRDEMLERRSSGRGTN